MKSFRNKIYLLLNSSQCPLAIVPKGRYNFTMTRRILTLNIFGLSLFYLALIFHLIRNATGIPNIYYSLFRLFVKKIKPKRALIFTNLSSNKDVP